MADRSPIEWTDATWTPIRARHRVTGKVGWHCEHASPGCAKCYSETFNEVRLGTGLPYKPGHRGDVEHFLDEAMLLAPLRWRRPRRIFVCSMTDLFGDWVPDAWIDRVFAVMAQATGHTFQVLTKRSARMRKYLADLPARVRSMDCDAGLDFADVPLPNVWLGVSAEDQRRADERVPELLATPAAVRFVSAEPLLGPLNLSRWTTDPAHWLDYCDAIGGPPPTGVRMLDLVIVGGESGRDARTCDLAYVTPIVEQCVAAGVACFVKQLGRSARMNRSEAVQAVALGAGWQADNPGSERGVVRFRDSHGGDMDEWPPTLRVRQLPCSSG